MSNPISRSEAMFKLRNIGNKISQAVSAAREGDWRIAFDQAYEASDDLEILLPHLDEAATLLTDYRDTNTKGLKDEPVGSLKYGVPPGTPTKRVGGMGYRGRQHNSDDGPVFSKRADSHLPPPPIINLPKPKPPIITPPPAPVVPPPPPPEPPKVGDWVQWESQGMLIFPKPMQVARFSADGEFAFFDGSDAGVPTKQLIPAEKETE